jgi:chromosome transmission fidelity protein 4
VTLSPDGNWVAVASDETVVKVVHTQEHTRILSLRQQSDSSKHVAFHPSGNYLAVSCADGHIYVYSLSSEEPELVKKLDGVIGRVAPDSEVSSKVAWHPDGRAFAAPTATRDIIVVSRSDWTTQRAFATGHTADITDFAWSPNGAFLASAGRDGKIVLWETKTQTILGK